MGQVLHGSATTTHAIRALISDRKQDRYAMHHIFDHVCDENGIEHRLTKVNHPWTNGQVERMSRTKFKIRLKLTI